MATTSVQSLFFALLVLSFFLALGVAGASSKSKGFAASLSLAVFASIVVLGRMRRPVESAAITWSFSIFGYAIGLVIVRLNRRSVVGGAAADILMTVVLLFDVVYRSIKWGPSFIDAAITAVLFGLTYLAVSGLLSLVRDRQLLIAAVLLGASFLWLTGSDGVLLTSSTLSDFLVGGVRMAIVAAGMWAVSRALVASFGVAGAVEILVWLTAGVVLAAVGDVSFHYNALWTDTAVLACVWLLALAVPVTGRGDHGLWRRPLPRRSMVAVAVAFVYVTALAPFERPFGDVAEMTEIACVTFLAGTLLARFFPSRVEVQPA